METESVQAFNFFFNRRLIVCFLLPGIYLFGFFFLLFQRHPLPVNQDEFLPLISKSFLSKTGPARSSLAEPYSRQFFGRNVPVISYPYVGALKGLLYHVTRLPVSAPVYRLFNLTLLWLFSVLVLTTIWQTIPQQSLVPVWVGLLYLLGDVAFFVMHITDEGVVLLYNIFGLSFIVLVWPQHKLIWWKPLVLVIITFLGIWNRLNCIWFMGAGLFSTCLVAAVTRDSKILTHTAFVILASLVGTVLAFLVVPDYLSIVSNGLAKSIPITTDMQSFYDHWKALFGVINPFSAYHRYIDIQGTPAIYQSYGWFFQLIVFLIPLYGITRAIASKGRMEKEATDLLFISVTILMLTFIIVKTREAWSSNHIMSIKPMVYIGLSVILYHLISKGRFLKTAAIGISALIGVSLTILGFKGYADVIAKEPIGGIYGVTWNSYEAIEEAGSSGLDSIFALDWGVFYPGVAMSPEYQRWEMVTADSFLDIQQKNSSFFGGSLGVLFKLNGPNKWLLDAKYRSKKLVTDISLFTRHRGEP